MQPILEKLDHGQSSSAPSGKRKVWDLVWKARVPQKMRVFAWRAATDSLGVLENLHKRITSVDPICTICGCEGEDAHHALVRCTVARTLREEICGNAKKKGRATKDYLPTLEDLAPSQ
jgi:hypothetical protein